MTSTLYNDHLLHAIWVLTLSIEYKCLTSRSSLSGFELCIDSMHCARLLIYLKFTKVPILPR